MTEDRSAVTIITIGGRAVQYRLTQWNGGAALIAIDAIDGEQAKQVQKASIVGYNNAGTIVRRERVWTD